MNGVSPNRNRVSAARNVSLEPDERDSSRSRDEDNGDTNFRRLNGLRFDKPFNGFQAHKHGGAGHDQ